MKINSLLPALIFFLFLFSCKKTDVLTEKTPDKGSEISFNINKTTLVNLVNAVRKSGCTCGATVMPPVPVITWSDQLASVAFGHSKDMNQNNYFSHTGLNGSTPGSRITAGGYNWKMYGENIALGYTSEQAVITGWLSSEGHCKNIMSAGFTEMGAGREANYWTQVFGKR